MSRPGGIWGATRNGDRGLIHTILTYPHPWWIRMDGRKRRSGQAWGRRSWLLECRFPSPSMGVTHGSRRASFLPETAIQTCPRVDKGRDSVDKSTEMCISRRATRPVRAPQRRRYPVDNAVDKWRWMWISRP